MKLYAYFAGLLIGLAMLTGRASTNVTQQTPMTAPGLTRPNQMWVYDFLALPPDMPADSSLAGQVEAPSTPPTPAEIETGHKYGAMIAQQLVKNMQAMGMPAIEAGLGITGNTVGPKRARTLRKRAVWFLSVEFKLENQSGNSGTNLIWDLVA